MGNNACASCSYSLHIISSVYYCTSINPLCATAWLLSFIHIGYRKFPTAGTCHVCTVNMYINMTYGRWVPLALRLTARSDPPVVPPGPLGVSPDPPAVPSGPAGVS
jgi:hypothetical protein